MFANQWPLLSGLGQWYCALVIARDDPELPVAA